MYFFMITFLLTSLFTEACCIELRQLILYHCPTLVKININTAISKELTIFFKKPTYFISFFLNP